MAKYLVQVRYTVDGAKGLQAEGGTARRAVTESAIASAGGKMEAFYFALGEVDAYVIADLPDDASLVALQLAVNATGRLNSRTVKLLTAEDVDTAVQRTVTYRPPGADATGAESE